MLCCAAGIYARLTQMRIAIIGSGAAGLVALRHSLDAGHFCDVFEKTDRDGGTWNYTEKTGKDEYGLPIHSSMYEGLSTNLPKELMQFEDFPHKVPEHSYISQAEVLKYINDYAEAFNLRPFIKFCHHVEKIVPLGDGKWNIQIKNLKSQEEIEKEYDAVFVCVGNYSVPSFPKFDGLSSFLGSMIHSHDYRNPDPYKNKTVLIVGSGPSGMDVGKLVAAVAHKTILSHRSELHPSWKICEDIIIKPLIRQFKERSVIFNDGSEEEIDDVIFCTGYIYSYPFLSPECGIEVEKNWVKYLYKHVINIKRPTMAFIGIPFRIFPFPVFGIQVRFFLSYMEGNISITKGEMMKEVIEYMKERQELGKPFHQAHMLGLTQGDYMDDLAETAKIEKLPPVFIKLYKHVHSHGRAKTDIYKIINDEEFVHVTK